MASALYHDALKGLARAKHSGGRLESPDRSARVDNPLCGDEVTMDVSLDGNSVNEVGYRVRGCLLCEASASWIGQHVHGADAATISAVHATVKEMLESGEVTEQPWPDTEVFAPVHQAKSRWRCVLLPFEALEAALADDS